MATSGGVWRRARVILVACVAAVAGPTLGQTLEWGATPFFKYNIENVSVTPNGGGSFSVKVVFSVTNPVTQQVWDVKNALPFATAGASLTLDIGWDPSSDFTNTGSANQLLSPVVTTALGPAAAVPVQVRNLQGPAGGAVPCATNVECPGVPSLVNRFWVARSVTPVMFMRPVSTGRVGLEGHPVCSGVPGYNCPATTPPVSIPVQSAVASFAFTPTQSLAAMIPDPRRAIVDIAKCKQCHDGKQHGATVVPRLALHGGNRNENLGLCVICHNPNQTDVPFRYLTSGTSADPRISGAEVPIDFKVLVHSIHAGGFRTNPFVVIGFNSSVNDFSGVRFPRELRDCTNCHIDANGKGTFELPLNANVLGTTVSTRSVFQVPLGAVRSIDVDPTNDLKMTPTAAACSACHDRSEVRSHMVRTGHASFGTSQQSIGTTVVERCASCHGPGKEEDVRRAHEIGRGEGSRGDDD